LKEYYDARTEDKDVVAIIEMTNEKGKKAKKKDEDLQNFWENIDAIAKGGNNTTSEGDSNE